MSSIASEFVGSITYPLSFSLVLILCGLIALVLRWRKLGAALVVFAFGWSLLWSVPWYSDWLRATLERQHAVVAETTLPDADAIVVLGGGNPSYWLHRANVRADQLKSSRVAAGARAWLAGRAPLIILSGGGGGNGRSEADMMAAAIARLGVPGSVLILEERSHDTRDNAMFTAKLAEQHDMQRVLLVTSALHMPRANLLFRETGLEVVPVPVPERRIRKGWKDRWLPTRGALARSGSALKEYAGLLAVHAEMKLDESAVLGCSRANVKNS